MHEEYAAEKFNLLMVELATDPSPLPERLVTARDPLFGLAAFAKEIDDEEVRRKTVALIDEVMADSVSEMSPLEASTLAMRVCDHAADLDAHTDWLRERDR